MSHLRLVSTDPTPANRITEEPEPASPFAPTGLVLKEGITFEEWTNIGATLGTMERGLNWWIGDWLNYGEHTYGEKYTQAVLETGRDADTLSNIAAVASRIEMPRRNGNLTWSHHQVVAYLDPGVADRLLDRAETEGWSVRALREAVKAAKNEIAPPQTKSENRPTPLPAPSLNGSNGNGAHPPAVVADDPDEADEAPELLHELEEADRTIRAQQSELESLRTDDHGSEIARLHERLARLESHQMREQTKLVEAQRLVKAHRKTLQQVSDLLGVKDFGEIVPTLQRLVR